MSHKGIGPETIAIIAQGQGLDALKTNAFKFKAPIDRPTHRTAMGEFQSVPRRIIIWSDRSAMSNILIQWVNDPRYRDPNDCQGP